MEAYRPQEVTAEAKAIARAHPTGRAFGEPRYPLRAVPRAPLPASFDPRRGRKEKVKGRGLRELVYGEETVDLSALDLFENAQVRALGALFKRLGRLADGRTPLKALVERALLGVEDLFALEEAPELAWVRPLGSPPPTGSGASGGPALRPPRAAKPPRGLGPGGEAGHLLLRPEEEDPVPGLQPVLPPGARRWAWRKTRPTRTPGAGRCP